MRSRNPGDPLVQVDEDTVGLAVSDWIYYEIPLSDLTTQDRYEWWLDHLKGRDWFTFEVQRLFFQAVSSAVAPS